MARVSWLHLSELLIGPRGSRLGLGQVRAELERDLRQMHRRTGPWDLVFISGDLTQTGSALEFDQLDRTLQSLWDYFDSLGSNPWLLAVPGNHDVFLPEASQNRDQAFGPYQSWFNARPGASIRIFRSARFVGDWAARIDRDGFQLGIIGLNTAWAPESRFTSGAVAIEQGDEATGTDMQAWCNANQLSLLMTHQAPDQMGRFTEALDGLAPAGRFALHLCSASGATPGLRGTERSRVWAAPSLFGGMTDDRRPLGYTVGVLEMNGSNGTIDFFPRAARLEGNRYVLAAGGGTDPTDEVVRLRVNLIGARIVANPPTASSGSLEVRTATVTAMQAAPTTSFASLDAVPRSFAGVRAAGGIVTDGAQVGWLSFSPSGRDLAVGLTNGELVLWNTAESRPRWAIQAHRTTVHDTCWSPDGKLVASQSDYHMRVWRVEDGSMVPLPERSGGGDGRAVAWSPTGALASGGQELLLWRVADDKISFEASVWARLPMIYSLAWARDGKDLAIGGEGASLILLRPPRPRMIAIPLDGAATNDAINDLAWQPGSGRRVAGGTRGGVIAIWRSDEDSDEVSLVTRLQGHTDAVISVSFSSDGRLLASKSLDGTVRLYRTDTWQPIAQLAEPASRQSFAGLAFAGTPASAGIERLATLAPNETGVRFWDIDVDALLAAAASEPVDVKSVCAKVVLIGEGRAGKSCVARRLVQGDYEELSSTHGMKLWSVPAAHLNRTASPTATDEKRDIVLWDLGGQTEYRLIHQLFLRDTTVALLAMEPGRGQPALDEIEGWLRRLPAELGDGRAPARKILVGTKVDDDQAPVDSAAVDAFVAREKLAGYVATSARTGRGIADLQTMLARELDWDALGRTSQPRLFHRIQKHLEGLIASQRVVLPYSDLERDLRREQGHAYDPEAVNTVVRQLARQGRLADTRMADGNRALIVDVEQIERYAGSLIVAARENRSGLPAIDLGAVLGARGPLPRMKPEERLPRDQEMVVIDCVVELLLEHGLCMRHEGLLIFPSLFPPAQAPDPAARRDVALVYSFTGSIDTIYPSLVSAVALAPTFKPMRLWEDRVEFGRAGKDGCGIRKLRAPEARTQETRGLARLEIYFDPGASEERRAMFVNVVEEHLRECAVELVEEETITCVCGFTFAEATIRKRAAAGFGDVVCPESEHRTPLTAGARVARERDPALLERMRALRVDMRIERQRAVVETKTALDEAQRPTPGPRAPLRILHLSDLHVTGDADPVAMLQPLLADLQDPRDGLGVDRLDYLVVSGDITNRASTAEFERARTLLSLIIDKMGLTAQRCVIVPGNHDLDWNTNVYDWKKKRDVDPSRLARGSFCAQGDGFLVRNDKDYPRRFQSFSTDLHHPLLQRAYPLAAEEQCIPHTFAEDALQVLAMNSAWEIDEYFRERSSINDAALARGLMEADAQLAAERAAGRLGAGRKVLRFVVWHHPITGNEKIAADAFLKRLQQADVRLCLHGHVHEERDDLIGYRTPGRQLYVAGAGSFGAPAADRPESSPRLYNLLEVARDQSAITVHTRGMRREGGAWEGWAVWPSDRPGEKRARYMITL